MTEPRDLESLAPGDFLRYLVEQRGWTQDDLADVLGKSASNVNQILTGKTGITADTAAALAEAFDVPAEEWMAREARFRLRSTKLPNGVGLKAKIYSVAPVGEMVKRRWIEGSPDPEILAGQVCGFLGIESLDETPEPFRGVAARKATPYSETLPSQSAWLCRVKQLAPAAPVINRYDPAKFNALVTVLRALVPNEPEIRRAARVLADFGVRFLIVEDIPGSKIDGVCVWLDEQSPVIALSLRYGRVDSFWHTLFHELGHMKALDGLKDLPTLDVDLEKHSGARPPAERAADKFAVETLIPPREMDDFIARVGPAYSLRLIGNFADRIGAHPAIVIGQLAHPDRDEILWSRFGKTFRSIRDYVTSSALTDGWGHVLPAMA